MKKLLLSLLLSILFFVCEEERNYESLIFLSVQQSWNIKKNNSHLKKKVDLSEEKTNAFNELNQIIDQLQNVKEELIFVSGGYKDSLASQLVGGNDQLAVRIYFYRNNEYKPYAINHFIMLLDKYQKVFEKHQIESVSFEAINAYNAEASLPLIYPYEKNLFENVNVCEALLIIDVVERQILLDIQNVLIKELKKEDLN